MNRQRFISLFPWGKNNNFFFRLFKVDPVYECSLSWITSCLVPGQTGINIEMTIYLVQKPKYLKHRINNIARCCYHNEWHYQLCTSVCRLKPMLFLLQYCLKGKCSTFKDAETRLDTCPYGNSPNADCSGVSLKPSVCYLTNVLYDCCDSCLNVSSPRKGNGTQRLLFHNTLVVSRSTFVANSAHIF